jgi:sugar phosphate isomerase/epimerase
MHLNIGIIGIVNEDLKRDYWGTCAKVAELGYKALEGGAPAQGEDVAAAVVRLRGLGMRYLSVHANRGTLEQEIDAVLERAGLLGARYVMVYWGPADSKAQVLADAALYNRVGARCAARGVKLCYHNHDHEFRTVFDGRRVFDLYLENTDPASVYFELDVAWATFGGANPAEVLRAHAGRIPVIHVKDLCSLTERGKFTTVGTGLVDIRGALQAALDSGVEWAVVEQDKLNHLTSIETAAAAIYNLRELGFAPPTYVAPPAATPPA